MLLLCVSLSVLCVSALNSDFYSPYYIANAQNILSISIDPYDLSIYAWGQYSYNQAHLTKMASNGSVLWQSLFGNNTFAGDLTAAKPQIDPISRDVFVAGWTRGGFDGQFVTTPSATIANYGANANGRWRSITWSAELGLFVAVSDVNSASVQIFITSNGINWVSFAAPVANAWSSVTWSPELRLLVAVAYTGSGNRVMTSTNGTVWTMGITPSPDHTWSSVCWSPQLNLFVAVASSNGIMTSPNGLNWTLRTAPITGAWTSVVWAEELGVFLAVASSANVTNNLAITSADGIVWLARNVGYNNVLCSVAWSPELGLFAALGQDAPDANTIITSPDGITWTARNTPSTGVKDWQWIAWIPEWRMFVAYMYSCKRMTSYDGINWVAVDVFAHPSATAFSPQLMVMVTIYSNFGPTNMPLYWQQSNGEAGFVSRLSSTNGTRVWTRFQSQQQTGQTRLTSMVQYGSNLIIGGTSRGFNTNGVGVNSDDAFLQSIIKSNGSIRWTSYHGSTTAMDRLYALDVDAVNGIIVSTGVTAGPFYGRNISGGPGDVFVAAHRVSDGQLLSGFTNLIGSNRADRVFGLAVDSARARFYVAGSLGGPLAGGGTNSAGQFISQFSLLDSGLPVQWTRVLSSSVGYMDEGCGLVVQSWSGNVYLAGTTGGYWPANQSAIVGGNWPNGNDLRQTYYGGYTDISLLLFSGSSGALLSSVSGGSQGIDAGVAIDVFPDGSLAISGLWNNQAFVIQQFGWQQRVSFTIVQSSTGTVTTEMPVTMRSTATETATATNSLPIYSFFTSSQTVYSALTSSLTETVFSTWTAAAQTTESVTLPVQTSFVSISVTVATPVTIATTVTIATAADVSTRMTVVIENTVTATVTTGFDSENKFTATISVNNGANAGNNSDNSSNQSALIVYYAIGSGAGGIVIGVLLTLLVRSLLARKNKAKYNSNNGRMQAIPVSINADSFNGASGYGFSNNPVSTVIGNTSATVAINGQGAPSTWYAGKPSYFAQSTDGQLSQFWNNNGVPS